MLDILIQFDDLAGGREFLLVQPAFDRGGNIPVTFQDFGDVWLHGFKTGRVGG